MENPQAGFSEAIKSFFSKENLSSDRNSRPPQFEGEKLEDEEKEVFIEVCQEWLDGWKSVYLRFKEELHTLARGEMSVSEINDFGERFHAALLQETGRDFRGNLDIKNYFINLVCAASMPASEWHERVHVGSMLAHDMAGVELSALVKFDHLEWLQEHGKTDPEAQEVFLQEKEWVQLARVALLKFIGIFEMSLIRVQGAPDFEKEPFDLKCLLEDTAQSIEFRYRGLHAELPGLQIEVLKEQSTDVTLNGSEPMIYLMLMNLIKNAAKIMRERKTPETQQKICLQLFERKGVLFLLYEDEAGGFDLNGILSSAIQKMQETVRSGFAANLSPTLSHLQKGPFQAAQSITLQNLCDLVFEHRVSARQGGSGLGLHEVKEILGMHCGFVQATPSYNQGAHFLIGFNKAELPEEEFKTVLNQVHEELDARVMARAA